MELVKLGVSPIELPIREAESRPQTVHVDSAFRHADGIWAALHGESLDPAGGQERKMAALQKLLRAEFCKASGKAMASATRAKVLTKR